MNKLEQAIKGTLQVFVVASTSKQKKLNQCCALWNSVSWAQWCYPGVDVGQEGSPILLGGW